MRSDVIAVTTHIVPGYRVVKVYGVVHGLTARTRGLGGKIVGSLQSLVGWGGCRRLPRGLIRLRMKL